MSVTKVVWGVMAIAAVAGSCAPDGPDAGRPLGTPEDPRVIVVKMVDIGFEPSVINVRVGETIEFEFANDGALRHEAVFGDDMAQEDHELEMQQMGGMAMDHHDDDTTMDHHDDDTTMDHHDDDTTMDHHDDDIVALAIEPGGTDTVVMSFDTPGHTFIGCHEAGHWAAGMRVDIVVA